MRIMDVFGQVNHNNSKIIQGFGINVDSKFIEVPARKLLAPTIQYKNCTITPKNGVWNPVQMEFLITEPAPASGVEWGVLNTDRYTDRGQIIQMFNKV